MLPQSKKDEMFLILQKAFTHPSRGIMSQFIIEKAKKYDEKFNEKVQTLIALFDLTPKQATIWACLELNDDILKPKKHDDNRFYDIEVDCGECENDYETKHNCCKCGGQGRVDKEFDLEDLVLFYDERIALGFLKENGIEINL